jgi:hypothetical protein
MNLTQWAQKNIALFIVVLGVGVFLWGTAYKLSLYESSPIHHKVAVAKLLTDSGKTDREQAQSAIASRPVVAFPILLNLALFFFALSLHHGKAAADSINKPQWLVQFYFPPATFLRPPPFPLHG